MVKLNGTFGIKFLSGLLLVSSLVLSSGACQVTEAAVQSPSRGRYDVERAWPDRNEMAATIANSYGVPYGAVLRYCKENGCLEDACHIAYMAKLTATSFDQIAGLKNKDNTWIDVSEALGITEDQVRAYRNNALAERINARYGLDKASIAALIEKRYKISDIVKASRLAKAAGMDVMAVMGRKDMTNTWAEVEKQLLGCEIDGL